MNFVRYSAVNTVTFLLDLLVLYILVDIFAFNYLLSASMAFIVATTLTYSINRIWTFKNSDNSIMESYPRAVTVALATLLAILGLMYVSVQMFKINYLIARIVIALLAAVWSFVLDKRWSFGIE